MAINMVYVLCQEVFVSTDAYVSLCSSPPPSPPPLLSVCVCVFVSVCVCVCVCVFKVRLIIKPRPNLATVCGTRSKCLARFRQGYMFHSQLLLTWTTGTELHADDSLCRALPWGADSNFTGYYICIEEMILKLYAYLSCGVWSPPALLPHSSSDLYAVKSMCCRDCLHRVD